MDIQVWLATMTVTQFRAFKKALNVLHRAGICTDEAIDMLYRANERKRDNRYPASIAVR